MLKDCNWSFDRDYKSGTEDEPLQFYMDGLINSKEFYLLLGFFSSAAISLLSIGFATFISKGGKVKMVINHLLSEKDKEAIKNADQVSSSEKVFDLSDVVSLGKILDEYDVHFFECLAYLIAEKKIEIKVIKPKEGKGIAHYKSGVFSDGESFVGYKASCNFTLFGLSENLEELEAFLGWEDERSSKLINKQLRIIDNYFKEKDDGVEYLESNDIEVAIRDKFGNKDINELIVKEEDLIKKKTSLLSNKKLENTFRNLRNEIEIIRKTPKFPYKSGPRDYQVSAYNNWVENNYRGIFAMATGTGKTITSLNCLLNEYIKTKVYKAIILVPTVALLRQWKEECIKFNFCNIITISNNENWGNSLAFLHTTEKFIDTSYIVIVTYASFCKPKFQSHFKNFPSNTLLIADEVHNLGSLSLMKLLPSVHILKRIGLSATPQRKFDEIGNEAIENFFNDKYPYVVSFSMQKALELDWLSHYNYYPHVVTLNDAELKEYIRISKILFKYLDPSTGKYKKSETVDMLLLSRKRIIHKAVNKIDVFKGILRAEFNKRGNLKYTLVYVPEGLEPDYTKQESDIESIDDINLIDEYTKTVSDTDDSLMVKKFTSNSTNREKILKEYEEGKIHILTSMKCLDEGVDIPRSELAIFCSSTGNPRQFIQRRGRVLRLHDEKLHAVIHDLVVVPKIDANESFYEMERNLVRKELERVADFASLATNKIDSYESLKKILEYYNLNLYD